MRAAVARSGLLLCACLAAGAARAQAPDEAAAALAPVIEAAAAAGPAAPPVPDPRDPASVDLRTGRGVYDAFRHGLADPACDPAATARWRQHFGHVPRQLASHREPDVLPLFGYVVGALREAHLPTEFALVPFVESGYRPGARSASGPAGLWQFIGVTARNHRIAMRGGYDGRLSPVDSTTAAVRYLKTLHGMFAGDWRLAAMAFNAGEYRVLGALKHHGQKARTADPAALTTLSPITQSYVRKLHALACLMLEAGEDPQWLAQLERPVPVLAPVRLAPSDGSLDGWARRNGHDPVVLKRLNPAFAGGKVTATGTQFQALAVRPGTAVAAPVLVPKSPAPELVELAKSAEMPAKLAVASTSPPTSTPSTAVAAGEAGAGRRYTVVRGDTISRIAKRHGITTALLLERNGLARDAVLKPGMVLQVDAAAPAQAAGTGGPTPVAH